MLLSIKSILLVGIIVLAAAFGDKAFSYEDIEENRRVIITQNGNTAFSVTDGAGRSLGNAFEDTKATPYIVAATVNTRVDFKQAIDEYIDAHISVVAGTVTTKLADLGMDSALYSYRQENINFDGKNYQINYAMLIQRQGDYVVLERRLIPENPTFIAAYHIGQNTGDNYLPASVQPRGQNKLILALTDENGAAVQIRQSATIIVTSSVASYAAIETTLVQTVLTSNWVLYVGYLILTNEYSHISTHLSVSYGDFATAILTVGDNIKLDGNAYHPSKSGIINFSDAHRCVIGNHDPNHTTTDTNGLQYYPLTTGGETLQVAKAVCQPTGASLKDIIESDAALSLGEVEGLIYVVVDNFSAPFPELSVIAISSFVNNNTATVSCGYFKFAGDYIQMELEAKFIPHAYISYYWVDPRTWDSQLLRTKKFVWSDDSVINEIAVETEDILDNKTVTVRFIAQANSTGTVPTNQIVLPTDWADVAKGQVVAGQFHSIANLSLNTPPPPVITSLDLGIAEASYLNMTIITNGLCKDKDYHCWGSTDENADLNSGFLHDLMMRVRLSIVACGSNFTAQIITEVAPTTYPITKPHEKVWVGNHLRHPTKLSKSLTNIPTWLWKKAHTIDDNVIAGNLRPGIHFIAERTLDSEEFRFYAGGFNPPEMDFPGCDGSGEIHSPPPNSWVFPIKTTGKCENLDNPALYLGNDYTGSSFENLRLLLDLKPND